MRNERWIPLNWEAIWQEMGIHRVTGINWIGLSKTRCRIKPQIPLTRGSHIDQDSIIDISKWTLLNSDLKIVGSIRICVEIRGRLPNCHISQWCVHVQQQMKAYLFGIIFVLFIPHSKTKQRKKKNKQKNRRKLPEINFQHRNGKQLFHWQEYRAKLQEKGE